MIIGLMYLLCSYFQIRPEHSKFRNGPPANLEQQDVMFRKAHVTGESAAIAGQEEKNGSDCPIMLDADAEKKRGKESMVARIFLQYTTML